MSWINQIRERVIESDLPRDQENEQNVIGAVLIAPLLFAREIAEPLSPKHFHDLALAWLWEKIKWELAHGGEKDRLLKRIQPWAKDKCGMSLLKLTVPCLREAFWWHGHWYAEKVLAVYEKREKIIKAGLALGQALMETDP